MAKKKITTARAHRQCKHCRVVETEFLSIKGEPIMGECIHSNTRLLLNEKTECKLWKE